MGGGGQGLIAEIPLRSSVVHPRPPRSVAHRGRVACALLSAATIVAASCTGATDAIVLAGDDEPTTTAATTTTLPLPACVAQLTPEQKAGQLLMVLVPSPAAAGDLVGAGLIGGYALVGPQSGDVAGEVAAVASRSRIPVFASGDEEGGTVQRFRDMLGALPSAATLASEHDPAGAARIFGEYGAKLKGLGLNMNFGPSLDVGGGSGLGTRSFSDDVARVGDFGLAVIGAVEQAGLIPVAKHWPGIGGGVADPHKSASPIAPVASLRERDMVPFDRAIAEGLDAIMVSHAIVPDLSDGLPASLSRSAITGELRERHRFEGLVVTDSLGMGAVAAHYDNSAAAVVSIAAGADIALVSMATSVLGAHSGLVGAITSGSIPAEQIDRSVGRVLTAKGVTGDCP